MNRVKTLDRPWYPLIIAIVLELQRIIIIPEDITFFVIWATGNKEYPVLH